MAKEAAVPMSRISIVHLFHKVTIKDDRLQVGGQDDQFLSVELFDGSGRCP
jgi:hypothetical protein